MVRRRIWSGAHHVGQINKQGGLVLVGVLAQDALVMTGLCVVQRRCSRFVQTTTMHGLKGRFADLRNAF
jgi:hypothetical protein